jgi:hypothetical protein
MAPESNFPAPCRIPTAAATPWPSISLRVRVAVAGKRQPPPRATWELRARRQGGGARPQRGWPRTTGGAGREPRDWTPRQAPGRDAGPSGAPRRSPACVRLGSCPTGGPGTRGRRAGRDPRSAASPRLARARRRSGAAVGHDEPARGLGAPRPARTGRGWRCAPRARWGAKGRAWVPVLRLAPDANVGSPQDSLREGARASAPSTLARGDAGDPGDPGDADVRGRCRPARRHGTGRRGAGWGRRGAAAGAAGSRGRG